MASNSEPGKVSSDLSLFSAGLIPFALSNIGNQKLTKFVSRGMAVGIVGKMAWDYIKSKRNNDVYTSVNIHEGSVWFDYVIRWLSQTKVEYQGSEFEFVALDNIRNNKQEQEEVRAVAQLHGEKIEQNHSFDFMPSSNCKVIVDGIEVIVVLERMNRDNNNARWAKDKFVIKVKSKKEEDLRRVFAQIEELGHTKVEYPKTNIYTFSWDWRRTKQLFKVRDVVLPDGQFEKLKKLVQKFLDSRESYADKGLNWRIGILLEGISGSGKTTTVQAIATHFNLDVYIINLSEMDDAKLMEAINRLPEKCILLLEDVRKGSLTNKTLDGKLSSSGLLNCLDGLAIPEGRICFMTTNFKEELDPILIRPGRIDYQIEFTFANKEQMLDLAQKFDYNLSEELAENWEKEKVSMSEIQNRLLELTK